MQPFHIDIPQAAHHPDRRRARAFPARALTRTGGAALPAGSIALLLDGAGARGVLPTARAVGRLRPGEGLGQLRCPVMAIGADHDAISPLPDLAAFAQAVPAAQTVVLEGTGHMVMLERPDAFNTEITASSTACPRR
jgi:pimeloyl-ACP methyl ester carboxylesterase